MIERIKKWHRRREVHYESASPSSRMIVFTATKEAADDLREFGEVTHLGLGGYTLIVDDDHDFLYVVRRVRSGWL